ncbi:MAG: multiheme c-type cytochrome, partial [Bacteroidota bacterium]
MPRVLVPLALALVLVAAYGLASCRTAIPEAFAGDADWTYVGDVSCQQCHADLATSYAQTGMGKSVSVFDPGEAPERFDASGEGPVVCAADGYCYQPFVRADSLFMRETRPDAPGYERTHAVSHVVGSGHATRSYFMAAGGGAEGAYLTEMPLTWYVEREIWDLSPGYEQTNERFERPITLGCHTCHNGRPGFEESQNFFTSVPLGISCERCHGPGSAHVSAYEGGGEPLDSRIVNPADLPTDLQLDVCQQCHLTGETVYAVGEDATTYRPGRPLSAHRSVYVTEASLGDPEAFGIASHAERMMKSACFEESLGTEHEMTCTTCHDPHQPVAQLDADHFSAACQSCHAESAHVEVCSRPEATTLAEAVSGDCASCHMREAGTSDIPHVSFTDHWIRREPPAGRDGGPTADSYRRETPFRLVEMTGRGDPLDAAEAEVRLGMATFLLYETRHRLPAYLPEVAARIRTGLAGGADRTDARVTLGRALFEMDSLASAERVLAGAAQA